jgi:hypothetical protein
MMTLNSACYYARCHLCLMSFMLRDTNKLILLSVIMFNVIMLNVNVLSVIIQNVMILSVVVPWPRPE